jgi:hypothetical protein
LIKPNEQVKHPPVGRWDAQTARTPYPKSLSPLLAQSANWLKSPNGLLRAKSGHKIESIVTSQSSLKGAFGWDRLKTNNA